LLFERRKEPPASHAGYPTRDECEQGIGIPPALRCRAKPHLIRVDERETSLVALFEPGVLWGDDLQRQFPHSRFALIGFRTANVGSGRP
jgi:hypothetical protein